MQEDPHWNTGNMIYGDDPVELAGGVYAPSIAAIVQSGNRYPYAMNNPVKYAGPDGESVLGTLAAIGTMVKAGLEVGIISSVIEGTLTGIAYAVNGKDYNAGFVNGSVSGFVSGFGSAFGAVGLGIGSGLGTIWGQHAEDAFTGNSMSYTNEEYALMATESIFYSLPSMYWPFVKDSAKDFVSELYEFIKYDQSFEYTGDMIVSALEKFAPFVAAEEKQ